MASILEELQLVKQAAQEQTAASQALSEEVAGKMGELDTAVNSAVQRVDSAIPTAIQTELFKHLWLDPEGGSDLNNGSTSGAAFKTLKALIDSVPWGGGCCVRGSSGLVVDINEGITAVNKHIVLYLIDCTLNFNAKLILRSGSFKNFYRFKEINQSCADAIEHYSADIRLISGGVKASSSSKCLFKQVYTGGSVSDVGSHHSVIFFRGTVNDAVSQYYVFSPLHYQSSMVVTTFSLTLGVNVALFDPVYSTLQVGTKGVYLVGA